MQKRKTKYGWENMEQGDSFVLEDISISKARKVYIAGWNWCKKNKPGYKILRKHDGDNCTFVMTREASAEEIKKELNLSEKNKRIKHIGIFDVNTCELLLYTQSWEEAFKASKHKNKQSFMSSIARFGDLPNRSTAFGYRWAYFVTSTDITRETAITELTSIAEKRYYADKMKELIKNPYVLNKASIDVLKKTVDRINHELKYGTKDKPVIKCKV